MGENPSDFNAAQQPVENVSWQDATKFVGKLNQRGDGFTYRLPHETEWEYAARANGGMTRATFVRGVVWPAGLRGQRRAAPGRRQETAELLWTLRHARQRRGMV